MATATRPREDQTIVEFDVRTEEMLVNMGPQHPSTHGVLRLILTIEGETVVKAIPDIGFLHTGIADRYTNYVAGLRQGLAEAGYVEGQKYCY